MPLKLLPETLFKRSTEEDPNGWRRFFRMGNFSWFNQPEGQGCVEKCLSLNYMAFWTQTIPIGLYYIAFKKIRNPLGVAYYYGKCAWPLHAFATTFAVTACALNNFRGKDDGWNWAGAGFLAGAMPGLGVKPYIVRKKLCWNGRYPYFMVPVGMFYTAFFCYHMKENDPRWWVDLFMQRDEIYQFIPEKTHMTFYEEFTIPGERISLDFLVGKYNDIPSSWIGEKWQDRKNIIKQEYGYLESELDKVPEIEKAIHNRM